MTGLQPEAERQASLRSLPAPTRSDYRSHYGNAFSPSGPGPTGHARVSGGSGLARLQLVEDVAADHVHLLEAAGPAWAHVVGVVMGGAADLGQVGPALHYLARHPPGGLPGFGVGDAERLALARERELAGEVAMPVLIDDAAH